MTTERGTMQISLESLGSTQSTATPASVSNKRESRDVWDCTPESLQKSFVFVSDNESENSGSIVVLGTNSLDAIRTRSLVSYEQIHEKSMAMDCQSIISSLGSDEVEQKLTELLQENLRLKETLEQNSLTMKEHLSTLMTRQEELAKVHKAHKYKFTELKNLVNQLKLENNELKATARLEVETINDKKEKDENTLTANARERAVASTLDNVSSLRPSASIDNEFASDMLKLAEKSEEQTKEIAHLQEVIRSLNRQLEPIYRNVFAGIRLEDVRSNIESPEDSHRQCFLENFTSYNEKLKALCNCYNKQTSRYTSIQECLQGCGDILSKKQKVVCPVSGCSRESLESQKFKELEEHRNRLMDEELETMVERQEMIHAQNEFQKIFTDYNSTLLELESLRQERERMTCLERGVNLHEKRLDEAKARLKESEKLLEQEREGVKLDRLELSEQKQALERQRLDLQKEERNFIEANASLYEEMDGMRETNDALQRQLKIYEEEYERQTKLQENMIAEKNELLAQMSFEQ